MADITTKGMNQQISRVCGYHNALRLHTPHSARRSTNVGFPHWHIVAKVYGYERLIFAYVKTDNDELSADELHWIERIRKVHNTSVYAWVIRGQNGIDLFETIFGTDVMAIDEAISLLNLQR